MRLTTLASALAVISLGLTVLAFRYPHVAVLRIAFALNALVAVFVLIMIATVIRRGLPKKRNPSLAAAALSLLAIGAFVALCMQIRPRTDRGLAALNQTDAGRLSQVYRAMRVYASENEGQFPLHVGHLMRTGLSHPSHFQSAFSPPGRFPPYDEQWQPIGSYTFGDYVWTYGGQGNAAADHNTILGFRRSYVPGSGAMVLFADGRVIGMSYGEFDQLIDAENERRGLSGTGHPISNRFQ